MPLNANPSAVDLSTAIAKVAKETIPAVAHIEVTQRQEVNNPFLPFENDPFFHYFFDVPHRMPRKFKRELKGLGSGMIMDAQGHILTNNHVVAGANEIQVFACRGNNDYDKEAWDSLFSGKYALPQNGPQNDQPGPACPRPSPPRGRARIAAGL